jgi:predicted flap endonuclease-1-like 5' DNA nuclease
MSTKDGPASIGDLPAIGRPATSALMAAGITTLAQVATSSRRELLAMHGVGPKAVRLLEAALQENGLSFAAS